MLSLIMNRSDHENYNKAVALYLKRDMKALKNILKGKTLDSFEKKLIRARLLNLEGRYDSALETLMKGTTSSKFLRAQKFNVLSTIYDRTSQYQNAALANHQAIENYLQISDESGLYISYLNLSINYSRLSLKELYEYAWQRAFEYAKSSTQKVPLVRSKASFLSLEGKLNQALDLLLEYDNSNYPQSEQNYLVFKNLIADILFRLKRYDESFEIYKTLYKKIKSTTRERVYFEYHVTKAFVEKTKLSKIPEFFLKESEYYLLWKTLLHFQDGEPSYASQTWHKLQKLNPDKYLEHFEFKEIGDMNCHFKQFLSQMGFANTDKFSNPFKNNTNAYRLYDALVKAGVGLRKEVLIEKVWNIEYDPDFDSRFYKLIQRVKESTDVNIILKNSTYQIVS